MRHAGYWLLGVGISVTAASLCAPTFAAAVGASHDLIDETLWFPLRAAFMLGVMAVIAGAVLVLSQKATVKLRPPN